MSTIPSILKIINTLKDMANNIRKKLFQEYIEENKMTLFEMPDKIDQIVAVSGFNVGTELQTYKNSTYTYSNITSQFSIPSGAYNTNNKIHILNSGNIASSNIKYGASFGGITGNYTYLSTRGIYAGVILTGYTGFVNGSTIRGVMTNRSSTTVAKVNYSQTLPAGYYSRIIIPAFTTATSRTTSIINSTATSITGTRTTTSNSTTTIYSISTVAMMNMASFNLDTSGYAPSNILSSLKITASSQAAYIGVNLTAGKTYQIYISGNFDTYLRLYNSNNLVITSNDDYNVIGKSRIQPTIYNGGTYIIQISGYNGQCGNISAFQFIEI